MMHAVCGPNSVRLPHEQLHGTLCRADKCRGRIQTCYPCHCLAQGYLHPSRPSETFALHAVHCNPLHYLTMCSACVLHIFQSAGLMCSHTSNTRLLHCGLAERSVVFLSYAETPDGVAATAGVLIASELPLVPLLPSNGRPKECLLLMRLSRRSLAR